MYARNTEAETRAKVERNGNKTDKPQATGNRRLAEHIRKILGEHYASKFRVR
jgi:hypothetical protein